MTVASERSAQGSGLRDFFAPRSIAVVGASESSGWTAMLLEGIACSAHPPEVHLVNPARSTVHGRLTVASVGMIEGPVDLAFVQVSPERVVEAVEQCLEVGVRDFVVLSAGLGEASEQGREAEDALVELARRHGARLLGPNVSGFINPVDGISVFSLPVPAALSAGGVGLVMQSGGLSTHALGLCAQWGVGISRLVTTGNEACITAADVVDHLAADDETRVIAVFLESVRDHESFREACRRAARAGKPIVVLAVGRSELGRASALAHTGALVGDHAATVAALEELGAVSVDSFEDLMATAALLAKFPDGLPGPRMAVVAASGGACELIADHAQSLDLCLPAFPPDLTDGLAARMPVGTSVKNPLDVTGFVVKDGSLVFDAAHEILNSAPGTYDAMLFQSVTFPTDDAVRLLAVRERFAALGRLQRTSTTPVLMQTAATFALTEAQAELVRGADLLVLPGIATGLRAIAAGVRSRRLRDRAHRIAAVREPPVDRVRRPTLAHAIAAAGLPMTPTRVVTDAAAAAEAASELGLPVVVKVVSAAIAHKSDVGGVALGLETPVAVRDAVVTMARAVGGALPDVRIEGYEVAPMRPPGVELLVSVVEDAAWGPILTVGAGGVLAEMLADVSVRALPVDRTEVARMLGELRCRRLLDGYRGSAGADVDLVVDAILAVVRLFAELGGSSVVEVNPLWARGDQVEALDLLIGPAAEGSGS